MLIIMSVSPLLWRMSGTEQMLQYQLIRLLGVRMVSWKVAGWKDDLEKE